MYQSYKIEPYSTGVLLSFTTNGQDGVVFCTADKEYLAKCLGETYVEFSIGTELTHNNKRYRISNLSRGYCERDGFACEEDLDLYYGQPASYFFNIYIGVELVS
ncbi:MAG: hypothetical protein M5Z89_10410 [Olivibacter sp.]|nr:hypothetical protein [Olivibacter sp. UJ_SKK_5.1]